MDELARFIEEMLEKYGNKVEEHFACNKDVKNCELSKEVI